MKKLLVFIFLFYLLTSYSVAQITFSPHVEIQYGGIQSYCVSDDFNNDGITDLITATKGNNSLLLWMYKQQNGSFIFYDTIRYNETGYWGANNLTSGDLNNDGLKDLVIAYSDTIKIYFQDSVSGFFNSADYITFRPDTNFGIHGLACGDLNSDGLCDIAAASWTNSYPSNLFVYYQNSNQSFSLNAYYKRLTYNNELVIEDINNDARNDLIVINGGTYSAFDFDPEKNCFAIYLQDSNTNYLQYPRFYAIDTLTENYWVYNTVSGFAVGDLDNDGFKDIVASFSTGSLAHVWHHIPGDPDFFPNPPDTLIADINISAVYIKDLNHDDKKEIIINSNGHSKVSIYESDSNYNFSGYWTVNIWNNSHIEQQMMIVNDLNDDSLVDIATTYSFGISILYNSTFIAVEDYANSNNQFLIYPSRTRDYFIISLQEEVKNGYLEIFNSTGNKILSQSLNSNYEKIIVTGWPTQIYFIKISVNGKQYTAKLLVD